MDGSDIHFGSLESLASVNVDSGKNSHPVIVEHMRINNIPSAKCLLMHRTNPLIYVYLYAWLS